MVVSMSRCVNPLDRWFSGEPNQYGVHYPVKSPDGAKPGSYHLRDCGRCIGCAARIGQDWAVRAYMEARMHPQNCVVCLTLEDAVETCADMVPIMTNFLKRLRWDLGNGSIRYLYVVERGGQHDRVHAHIILFGRDFREDSYDGFAVEKGYAYRSHTIANAWSVGGESLGFHHITPGDPDAIFYAAGDAFKNFGHESEFNYSKRPMLGVAYMRRWCDDFDRNGFLTIDGKKQPLPPAYLRRPEFKEPLRGLRVRNRAFREGQTLEDLERHKSTADSRRINLEAKLKIRRGEF